MNLAVKFQYVATVLFSKLSVHIDLYEDQTFSISLSFRKFLDIF